MRQIDHVELFVPDRGAAADWYERVLGLRRLTKTETWAEAPRGPLMISPDGGRTYFVDPWGTPLEVAAMNSNACLMVITRRGDPWSPHLGLDQRNEPCSLGAGLAGGGRRGHRTGENQRLEQGSHAGHVNQR